MNCANYPDIFVSGFPPGCNSIPGATAASYVSTLADAGKYIAVVVTGSNSNGGTTATALLATRIGTPVNVVAPTVSGSATLGSTWTVDTGTWAGVPAPTIVIYWLRCSQPITAGYTTVPAGCEAISGANGTTYASNTADVGKYLTAQVAGNSTLGFALAGAVSTVPVGFPVNAIAPTVSGSLVVGSTWTVDTGTWTGTPLPTIVIFWLRCDQPVSSGYTTVPSGCVPISGANGTTYVSTMVDVGKYLTTQVAGNSPLGFTLAGAVNVNAIQTVAPANTVAPTVSGSATVGSTWTVNTGTWTGAPAPAIAVFWLRCTQAVIAEFTTVPAGCEAISGANSTTYVSATADRGKYLTAQIAGNSTLGFALAGAINTVITQAAAPVNVVAPTVSGLSTVGSTWTVNIGSWTGSPAPTMVINWLRCNQPIAAVYTTVPAGCQAIPGATASSYVSTASDAGKYLTAQVAGNSVLGFSLAGAISTVGVGLPANLIAPTVSGAELVGSTWTVDTGTWSGSPAPTIVIFWLRCNQPITAVYTTVPTGCEAIGGANGTVYVPTMADVGKYLTAQVAGNGLLGFALAGAINTTPVTT